MLRDAFDRFVVWVTRTFRVGRAVVERWEVDHGHDASRFTPAEYGEYIATSVGVYACLKVRANNLRSLPIRLYKVNARGEKTPVEKGKLFDLLKKVNPFWTFGRLIDMTELALGSWGQAFWVLERGPRGRNTPSEIWWARPDNMKVVPDESGYLRGFLYEANGEVIPLLPGEVVWFRYGNPMDEFSGLAPLAAARLSIDTGIKALRSNQEMFNAGMNLGGVISPTDKETRFTQDQVDELERHFARRFGGADKAHRWAVLSGGVNATPLGISPKDAEFLGLMRWSLNDVCRVYQVPPPLVQDFERSTYNNTEQAYKALWTDCLVPEARMLAEEITEQLLPLFPGEADIAEFDLSGVAALQEDRSEIIEQMERLHRMGVPLNALLQEFQPNLLPPKGAGYTWGDVGFLPNTMTPAEQLLIPPDPAQLPAPRDERDEDDANDDDGSSVSVQARGQRAVRAVERWLAVERQKQAAVEYGSPEHEAVWRQFSQRTEQQEERLGDTLRRLFAEQETFVLARLTEERGIGADVVTKEDVQEVAAEPFDQAAWGRRLAQEARPLLQATLVEAAEAELTSLAVGAVFDLENPLVTRWLLGRSQQFARQVTATTWDMLKAALAEGIGQGEGIAELSQRVRAVYADAKGARAAAIARTETIAASNEGSLQAAERSGVVQQKQWVSALDERTRATHRAAHGQRRGLRESFMVGGATGRGPGQMSSAAESGNCRCTLIYVLKDERVYVPIVGRNGEHA